MLRTPSVIWLGRLHLAGDGQLQNDQPTCVVPGWLCVGGLIVQVRGPLERTWGEFVKTLILWPC